MNIHLSWDLFILVFFAIVIAYSFIIGRNQTLKVIVGTYVAILCADGLGNLFAKYMVPSQTFLKTMKLFSISSDNQAIIVFKILVLIFLVVVVSVRGLYSVDADDDKPITIRLIILLMLGVLSAGLMMSTVLVFVSGQSLIANSLEPNNPLLFIYNESRLTRIMLDYANVWFVLPGFAFILMGFMNKKV